MALNLGLNLKQDILAVDLGQNCIKVYRLQKSRGGIKAVEMITAETGYDPALPPEEFRQKRDEMLAEIWKEHKFKNRDVLLAIPGRGAIVRQFRIPRVTGERLDRMVRFEAKQQIPIPLEEVILDYHYFDTGEPELEVSLIAIRKNAVEEYVQVLKEAKLRPDIIDVAPLCLFNVFNQEERPPEEVVAVIDIGASETNIVIFQDRVVKFIRSAPVGGNLITEALAGQLDMTFAEAEEVKRSLGSLRPGEDTSGLSSEELQERNQLIRIVESSLDKVFGEIRRSIDFYISKPEGEALTQALLTGGTSRFEGIEELLGDRLGVPVEKASPFDIEAIETSEIEATGMAEISSSGLGLALRSTDKAFLSMNFIPPSVKQEKAIRGRMISLIVEGVLIAITMAAIVLHINSDLQKNREAIQYLDSILDQTTIVKQLNKRLAEKGKMDERFTTLQKVLAQRGLLANLLFEIVRIAPPEIWITRFQGAPKRIAISGKCELGESSKIGEFLDAIFLSPYFGPPNNPSQKPVGDYVEFDITINKLSQPTKTEVALIEALTKKHIDTTYAQVNPAPNGDNVLDVSIYGKENKELNDKLWLEIVDALVSSGVDIQRVKIYWMNQLGNVTYQQICKFEFCIALQKDEIPFDEFIKEKVRTLTPREAAEEEKKAARPKPKMEDMGDMGLGPK